MLVNLQPICKTQSLRRKFKKVPSMLTLTLCAVRRNAGCGLWI